MPSMCLCACIYILKNETLYPSDRVEVVLWFGRIGSFASNAPLS